MSDDGIKNTSDRIATAVVLGRAGSKGLPRKHVRLVAGGWCLCEVGCPARRAGAACFLRQRGGRARGLGDVGSAAAGGEGQPLQRGC